MKLLKRTIVGMGARAKGVLLSGLPIIIFALAFAGLILVNADAKTLCSLVHTFPLILENILFSLVLLVGGAVLVDLCEKESEEKY